MKKIMAFVVALCMVPAASVVWAMDIYDWRAKTEWICAQSFTMLERPILGNMAGGRPENLVIEKVKDVAPVIQELGETDATTAQIVIKSMVHSFFTDSELRLPIYTIKSVQRARVDCSANVVRYDPDGSKAVAYQNVKAKENGKKREVERLQAEEREKQEQEEERAQLAEQTKQDEENKAKEAEQARIRQEEESTRNEEQRRLKAEEDTRILQETEKRRAEVADRQKQQDETIKNMLKNTRTSEDFAREEAERKQKEEEAKKANSGLGGLIKSLW